jgi:hypothetical protein
VDDAVGVRDVAPGRWATGAEPVVIHPVDRPYWALQHWNLVGNRLNGFYRTPHGSVRGYVQYPQAPRPEFYIVQPPKELRQHSHWMCFHPAGADTFSVHFYPAPPSADAGILEIEKVLGEAFSGRGRRNA